MHYTQDFTVTIHRYRNWK